MVDIEEQTQQKRAWKPIPADEQFIRRIRLRKPKSLGNNRLSESDLLRQRQVAAAFHSLAVLLFAPTAQPLTRFGPQLDAPLALPMGRARGITLELTGRCLASASCNYFRS